LKFQLALLLAVDGKSINRRQEGVKQCDLPHNFKYVFPALRESRPMSAMRARRGVLAGQSNKTRLGEFFGGIIR